MTSSQVQGRRRRTIFESDMQSSQKQQCASAQGGASALSKRLKFDNAYETVTVEVGPERVKFSPHKKFICDASPYFRAAFNNSMSETGKQRIHEQEVTPSTFSAFMSWLYTRTYSGIDTAALSLDSKAQDELDKLMHLFVFAEKVGAQELKRQMVRSYVDMANNCDDFYSIPRDGETIKEIYDLTSPGSCLRKIVVNLQVWEADWNTEDVEAIGGLVVDCPDFATDLIKAFIAKDWGGKNPFMDGAELLL